MNSMNSEVEEGDEMKKDVCDEDAGDPATGRGHAIANGILESPECLSRVHSGDSIDDKSDAGDYTESAFNEKTENASLSQAYGGARPKTTRVSERSRGKNGEGRTKTSDNSGVDIKQKTCDPEFLAGPDSRSAGEKRTGITFSDISSIPKLESRPAPPSDKSVRLSIPDISREEVADTDLTEDDCYIYTYKGGTAYLSADLPNSFFRLDSGSDGESLPGVAGAGQSNLSTGVAALIQDQLINSPQIRSFSPEQDFIELDFDPGSESDGDSSSDSGQGRDGTDMEGEDREDDRDGTLSSQEDGLREREVLSSPEVQHNIILEPVVAPNNNNVMTKNEENCRNCDPVLPILSPATLPDPNLYLHDLQEPHHASSAPVLSPAEEVPVLMPRSKSLNSSLGDCLIMSSDPPVRIANLSLCGSRLLQREALIFSAEGETVTDSGQPAQDPGDPDLATALYKLSFVESIPSTVTQKAMIWTEKEAIRKQVTQLPNTSSCGATALLNVLLALELDVDLHLAAEAVHTELRRLEAPLPDYLLSRSVAGCTHADLLSAVSTTVPQVRARFFSFHNRTFQLAQWLAGWISRGLVPVLTLNVQKARQSSDGMIQDSWHHQMVWGVSGQEIYLANPLEMVHERLLVQQISSPSELLIRRSDIVSRFNSSLDLSEINSLGQRWQDMNVLGQVVNVIREEKSVMKEETVTVTSHVRIPASYSSGVTLFSLGTNEEGSRFLRDAPDLPAVRK